MSLISQAAARKFARRAADILGDLALLESTFLRDTGLHVRFNAAVRELETFRDRLSDPATAATARRARATGRKAARRTGRKR